MKNEKNEETNIMIYKYKSAETKGGAPGRVPRVSYLQNA